MKDEKKERDKERRKKEMRKEKMRSEEEEWKFLTFSGSEPEARVRKAAFWCLFFTANIIFTQNVRAGTFWPEIEEEGKEESNGGKDSFHHLMMTSH